MKSRALRRTAIVAAAVSTTALVLAGCASSGGDSGSDDPNAKITLTVATFNDFGYTDALLKGYTAEHPNATVVHNKAATQYLRQAVPDELIEAARVDGANSFRTFMTVGLPAARPPAAMLGLFTFVTAWNNFFWPFIVLDPQSPTLPVALSLLQSDYFVDYSIVLAGVLLSTVPLLILFIFAGKQLVSGIMAGAVKG
ncbi:hypothetical protein GCM10022240_01270 [Microbacterium kribbense]|uniref:ABC transmembrane type-1 domain-containing protein n=1 Tax=Microbacterium kribbense TaxID=433645 RepID=A0ABP7FYS8_9MICO